MSLRRAKKEQQRAAILANAIALLRERGAEGLRIRDIAERCMVSEATLFNYFAGKDAILGEWAHLQVELALEAALAGSDRSLRSGLRTAARALGEVLAADPALARLAFARAGIMPPAGDAPGRRLHTGWIERLRVEQEAGELRRDLAAEELATLFAATLLRAGAEALAAEATDSAAISARLARALGLLADGSRRRHERVRAPAVAATAPPQRA